MKSRILVATLPIMLVVVSTIGFGYAYTSSFDGENSINGDYCSVYVSGSIDSIKVSNMESYSYLEFGYMETGFQETLSLKYTHTRGTDLILTINFLGYTGTGAQTISCIDNLGNTIGSTSLSGSDVREGTITGIVLGFEGSTTGSIQLRFQVDGIATGVAMQMSFSVVPMEVTS